MNIRPERLKERAVRIRARRRRGPPDPLIAASRELTELHRMHARALADIGFVSLIEICDKSFVGLAGVHEKHGVLMISINNLREGRLGIGHWTRNAWSGGSEVLLA